MNRAPYGPVPARLPWAPAMTLMANQTVSGLARAAGVPRETIQRWKREGVTVNGADLVADALGLHPAEIWGDDFYQVGTTCHRGHTWDGNERWSGGRRHCGTCEDIARRTRLARRAAAEVAA